MAGTLWSYAGAINADPDFRLQISAWQHQFFDLFGAEALARVKGFSLPEMHLPNHPDTLYALIEALLEAGYRWLLQEHSRAARWHGTDARSEIWAQPARV